MRRAEAKKDAADILRVFDLLESACRNVQENGQCDDCPMRLYCLDGRYGESTVTGYALDTADSKWVEFLEYADECLPSESVLEDMSYAAAADYGRDEL